MPCSPALLPDCPNADGTVLLYDPRQLATPLHCLTCVAGVPVTGLHWQHCYSSLSSRMRHATAAKSKVSFHCRRAANEGCEQSGLVVTSAQLGFDTVHTCCGPSPPACSHTVFTCRMCRRTTARTRRLLRPHQRRRGQARRRAPLVPASCRAPPQLLQRRSWAPAIQPTPGCAGTVALAQVGHGRRGEGVCVQLGS